MSLLQLGAIALINLCVGAWLISQGNYGLATMNLGFFLIMLMIIAVEALRK